MTRQTFLRNLARTTKVMDWHLTRDGKIRGYCKGRCQCPITGVAAVRDGKRINIHNIHPWTYPELSFSDMSSIARAADKDFSSDETSLVRLRQAMLRALNLNERE
jgi:hypothetical protein